MAAAASMNRRLSMISPPLPLLVEREDSCRRFDASSRCQIEPMGGARIPAEMQNIPGRGLEAAGRTDHEGFILDPGFHQRVRPEVLDRDDPGRHPLAASLHCFGPLAYAE